MIDLEPGTGDLCLTRFRRARADSIEFLILGHFFVFFQEKLRIEKNRSDHVKKCFVRKGIFPIFKNEIFPKFDGDIPKNLRDGKNRSHIRSLDPELFSEAIRPPALSSRFWGNFLFFSEKSSELRKIGLIMLKNALRAKGFFRFSKTRFFTGERFG